MLANVDSKCSTLGNILIKSLHLEKRIEIINLGNVYTKKDCVTYKTSNIKLSSEFLTPPLKCFRPINKGCYYS
jgi:hypothetical protein